MTYENFVVPSNYWEYVLGQRRASFINDYYKKNKNYPTEDVLKNVVLTTEEKEQYKRIFYAQYKATGMAPSEPNTPQEPDAPSIPPVSGGDETEIPIIPPSSGNMVNVMFDITMDDIPETVGVGNNVVNTIFKQGILNGDLLDKSYCNITLNGGGTSIKIKDLTQIYSIPKGEYSVTGIIGNKDRGIRLCEQTYLTFNTTIQIENNGKKLLQGIINSNIVVSNISYEFSYKYRWRNTSTGRDGITTSNGITSFIYNNYNYVFVNNYEVNVDRLYENALSYFVNFGNIKYEISNEENNDAWLEGTSYYYNINTNTDYDEWFTMVYNVTTTKEPTKLFSSGSVTSIGTMKIDGELTEEVSAHTFNTLGRHEVKVLLKDTTKNGTLKFEDVSQLKELSIPSSINSLGSHFLYNCGGIEKIYSYAQKAPSIEAATYSSSSPTFYKINTNGILFIPQDSDYKVWLTNYTKGVSLYNYNWTKEYME